MKIWFEIENINGGEDNYKVTQNDIPNSIPNRLFHKDNGPARIFPSGEKQWWIDGYLHRLDGPAVDAPPNYKEWHIKGKRLHCNSQQEFEKLLRLNNF